ncbi:hypothetical protein GCM10011375_14590 [Hymenobacter qilianensis]|uniref:Uncharacterized protein n=2 Tax=Hymenobacter qilianensis TaxID=1385715 RepID=A0ACB5PQ17_9BACT|nr:hypothetical protein [Hymenobacter qilianensis]QNP53027.1 hypothetical protein H9L05_04920 [Hymenobacter qilianensis]GGF60528.1 hypothetical protein GCM10011375_14590 [Hymenobacter qilianensis]
MAEINIQRKKNSFSPWLLVLLVLAALAVGAYFLLRADSEPTATAPPATGAVAPTDAEAEAQARATPPPADGGTQAVTDMAAEETPASAEELARFAADEDDTPDYARRGLQLLTATLVDLTDRNDLRDSNITEKRNDLTSATSRLSETSQAGIRPGLVAAAALMQAMQQKAYPALARPVAELVQRADELPNQITEAEVPAVQEFLVRAADVVGTLSKPAS